MAWSREVALAPNEPDNSWKGLVERARVRGASDIHLRSGMIPSFRVDGELVAVEAAEVSGDELFRILVQIAPSETESVMRSGMERDLAIQFGTLRCRLHIFREMRGLGAVVRLLPSEVPTLAALGLPPVLETLALSRHGLILVTGLAGAGKTTTLAAVVDHINATRAAHIVTIEDPVEIVHQSKRSLITHREIGCGAATFSQALKAALRQDPDVVLIGELRDLESIQLALTAAETGHLVLATLHSGGAVQTIARLIDVFPGDKQAQVRTMLAESLEAVVSQKLLKRSTGGREPLVEVLIATPAVRTLIRENKAHQIPGIMQMSAHLGMVTTGQQLDRLQRRGVVLDDGATH